MLKKVKTLIPAFNINMGGIPLKQALPTTNVQQVDPFLLLHHGEIKYRKHGNAIHQGIGPHPHRGFSPVTFIIDGEIHHRDSRGNNQIAKKGEVQWMHAGMGIIHSERPSECLASRNGVQEIIQLWINSPAEHKMKVPYYRHLSEVDIPVIVSEDNKITNKLIAGAFEGKKSILPTESELFILWGTSEKNGEQTINIPNNYNTMLYLIKGSMRIKGYGLVDAENLLVFEKENGAIAMSFSEDSQFLSPAKMCLRFSQCPISCVAVLPNS